jgi:hypothetical protein
MPANCTNCDHSKVTIKYGEVVYSIFKELKYGIETCCPENRDVDIYNYELFDLMSKFDEDLTPLL